MEVEPIKLGKNEELESIRVKSADNGGCIISYTLYTPSGTHSESKWDEKTEVYGEGEFEEKVIPRIVELYKADYYSKMGKNVSKDSDDARPISNGY